MRYTVWDVETTTRTSYKRKANPFDPLNRVVMSGWRRGDTKGTKGKIHGEYFGANDAPDDWFIKLLANTDLLIGANIKFDILYAIRYPANRKAFMKWVASGGMIWDIQLAEYLLEGMDQANHMLSLDEMAPRYGGNTKFDEVKVLWDSGVDTLDIDPDLLREYLCGNDEEEGDIGNTEIVFLGQWERAKASGQGKSIWLNMGSLICTIEMEFNGMAIDVEEAEAQRVKLAEDLAALTVELEAHLPDDLPFQFSWSSHYHKSAMIFGGTIKYEKRTLSLDDQGNETFYQMDATAYYHEDGSLVYEGDPRLEDETWRILNLKTFAGGKNAGEYKTKKVKVDDIERGPKSAMRDFKYTFPGVTEPYAGWKMSLTDADGDPLYSTSGEVIEQLGNRDIPFLKAMSKVSGLSKDLSTYYRVFDEKKQEWTGMLTLVQADRIIHHMLNHTSTVTGRFSSSSPNLQNIPKEGKSIIKTVFVSRFKNGWIIQSDFSSLEVYIQAILTNCYQLIQDLKAGLDMHCVRVSQAENISYEDAYRLCVTEGVKEWKKKRTNAKIFSFQRAYGAGAALIAASTGMSRDDVDALILAENDRYPEIEKFYDELTDTIKENSFPSGKVVDHPEYPGVKCFFRKAFYQTPDGKRYTYMERVAPKFLVERGVASSFSPTEIKNYIVQGEGGEWAKAAMWLAVRAFYARECFEGKGLLVNQVHDALYADADDAVALEVAALLEACMVSANEFMEYYFGWEVKVPVPSDTTYGRNMMEEGKMPEGHVVKVAEFRQQLRDTYMDGFVPSFDNQLKQAA